MCSPSRAACLTGRLPPRTGIDSVKGGVLTADAVGGLPTKEITFADALGAQGYATAMLGKWHLGVRQEFAPTNRGFDYYYGLPFSVDMGTSVWHPEGGGDFQPTPLPLVEGTAGNGWHVVEQPAALHNLTDRYVEKATAFIADKCSGDAPWVLYMSFSHVHNPQFCSSRWCGSSTVRGVGPAVPSGHGGTGSAVQEMDWSVGQILGALDAAEGGCSDNTLVFFTSDNGAPANHAGVQNASGSNAPLSGFKGSILEGGIRMPAMARWPGHVRPGSTSSELVATYDMFTTMLSLAGAPLPTDRVIDGMDLTAVLHQAPGAHGHRCLFQYHAGNDLAAVRCGRWKVHYEGDVPSQLYDLLADAGEHSPIPRSTSTWAQVVPNVTAERAAHLKTVVPVPDQTELGGDIRYAFCGAPDSTSKYPKLPNCTLNPDNWVAPWPAPPPPTPVPGSAYVGCFWDKGAPQHSGKEPCDLPIVISGSCPKARDEGHHTDHALEAPGGGMTVEKCNGACAGHAYFGVQNGGTGCFCGPTYGRYGPATNCSMPCSGNHSEQCGGPDTNSIYRTQNTSAHA